MTVAKERLKNRCRKRWRSTKTGAGVGVQAHPRNFHLSKISAKSQKYRGTEISTFFNHMNKMYFFAIECKKMYCYRKDNKYAVLKISNCMLQFERKMSNQQLQKMCSSSGNFCKVRARFKIDHIRTACGFMTWPHFHPTHARDNIRGVPGTQTEIHHRFLCGGHWTISRTRALTLRILDLDACWPDTDLTAWERQSRRPIGLPHLYLASRNPDTLGHWLNNNQTSRMQHTSCKIRAQQYISRHVQQAWNEHKAGNDTTKTIVK